MKLTCNLVRDGVTLTSAVLDIIPLNMVQRWIASSLRGSGKDANDYKFVAWAKLSDISGTDLLEEVTGGITGTTYQIINKRELTGSHLEFDLKGTHADSDI